MKAGAFKAFYGGIAFLAVCAAGILTGCASGHKQFVYVAGPGTNETFEFRVQADGSLAPLGTPSFPVGSNPIALAREAIRRALPAASESESTPTPRREIRSPNECMTTMFRAIAEARMAGGTLFTRIA